VVQRSRRRAPGLGILGGAVGRVKRTG